MKIEKTPKYKKIDIDMPAGTLAVYASPKILAALHEVMSDMTVYKGVRLAQVLKAVYVQGMKDGRRDLFLRMDGLKKEVVYQLPGRPRKTKQK